MARDEGRSGPPEFEFAAAVDALKRGAHGEAQARLTALAKRTPDRFEVWHNLGFAHQAAGDWGEAATAYATARRLAPANRNSLEALAVARTVLGDAAGAAEAYRSLATLPEARLDALARLALLEPKAMLPSEIDDMQVAVRAGRATRAVRAALCFGLGHTLEGKGRFDDAFAAFAEGNALQRAVIVQAAGPDRPTPEQSAEEHAASIRLIRRLFTPHFLSTWADRSEIDAKPIFVVGMPRSGSTLIAQILSAHPEVVSLGETSALLFALRTVYAAARTGELAPALLQSSAREYLARSGELVGRGQNRSVDKMLDNYLHVGAIHLLFPRAVILNSVRDRIDTCLSIFRQLFTGSGNENAYSLEEIAGEHLRYEDMIDYWRAVLPGRVTDVRHDALLADPGEAIRRLVIETCGLPWNERCLRFHQTSKPVQTASAIQVRRPIMPPRQARWRAYAPHLGPLFRALGPGINPPFATTDQRRLS